MPHHLKKYGMIISLKVITPHIGSSSLLFTAIGFSFAEKRQFYLLTNSFGELLVLKFDTLCKLIGTEFIQYYFTESEKSNILKNKKVQ